MVRLKLMKVAFAAFVKANAVGVLGGKVPVFGLLKRGGRVYAKVIPDTKGKILIGIIQDRIVPDSIVYSDAYHSYNVLRYIRV